MNEILGFIIRIETKDAYLKIGPVFTKTAITHTLITDVIRDILTDNNQTHYSVYDVEDITVVGIGGSLDMVLHPKIEDVWPIEFGSKNETRNYWKGGEQK